MADTQAEFTKARIRVKRPGALVLQDALIYYEQFLLTARDVTPEARRTLNTEIKELRFVMEEVERTIEEMSWDKPEVTDEPKRPVETRPGS